MRKLDQREVNACVFLGARGGSYCLDTYDGPFGADVRKILDSLVKKKRATVESTDAGPRYSLTGLGWDDISA